jgi:hypothetical protein
VPIEQADIDRLQTSFAAYSTGKFGDFFCPILEESGTGTGLMYGHVLNKALKKAARRQVVQRKDVDEHFGSTIEPEFIHLMNVHMVTPAELVRQHRKHLRAVSRTYNEEHPVFYPSRKSQDTPFPQFELTDAQRQDVGTPHVKLAAGAAEGEQYDLRTHFVVRDAAFYGSLLKSGYLALFDVLGYRVVFDPRLKAARESLAGFVRDRATAEQAGAYFDRFKGAMNAFTGVEEDEETVGDTITSKVFVAHRTAAAGTFAMSVLLRINDRTFGVTLPVTMPDTRPDAADAAYEEFLGGGTEDRVMQVAKYIEHRDQFFFYPPMTGTA